VASKVTTEQVFGIRIEPVLSYVARPNVDGAFEQALKTTHHVVVYGSSKQGKTALRQKHLDDRKDCAIVRPSPRTTVEDIYHAILRNAGITINTVETSRTEAGSIGKVRTGFKALIPFLGGADVAVEGETKRATQMELRSEFVGYDLSEAQSVGELLAKVGFKKFIVIENFHYLSADTQKQLAFDLKTFHEIGLRFIILGIWREANRLLQFNNDLQDRIIEIPVEPWLAQDLKTVAAVGTQQLNVEFSSVIVDKFIENAYGNVGLFQEFLKGFCLRCGINEVQDAKQTLVSMLAVTGTFDDKLRDQRNTLLQSLTRIAASSRTRTDTDHPLILPYYLVKVICQTDLQQLRDGIDKKTLLDLLRSLHHRTNKSTIRIGDVTNLLNHLPALQEDMQPPLLYFDGNARRLKVVDTRQFFVLARVDRKELEEEIPNPLED
jgi:hypothetical protein